MINTFKNCLLLVCALLFFIISSQGYAKTKKHKSEHLSLFVGFPRDVKIPLAPKNFGTDGSYKKFTKVQYNSKEKVLRFKPKSIGDGTLVITNKKTGRIIYEFSFDVKKTNVAKTAREIQNLLRDIEGINIKILNNRVVVDGEVILPSDVSRIFSVINQYPESLASSLVRLSPLAQVKIARYMERAINNPEISVKAVNGLFLLEGFANSEEEKKRAFILAQAYLPDQVTKESDAAKKTVKLVKDKIINLVNVKPPPQAAPKKIVQVVVHYVELNKNYQKGFRFQWTPSIGDGSNLQFSTGNRGPAGVLSTITGTISNLIPKLNWAKQHGHARVLQSSSIIVQDGQKGVLNSTSDIPYQTSGRDGALVTGFVKTGLQTSITPTILGERSDSIRLQSIFSIGSFGGYTDQGPLTSKREINTTLVVRSGQSAAVGGLISSTSGTNYNKLPKGVKNPIISLYASKDFQKSQSQFVVFITPIIKSSASAGAQEIKRKFRIRN